MSSGSGRLGKKASGVSGDAGLAVLVWSRSASDTVDPAWIEDIRAQLTAPLYSLATSDPGLTPLGTNRKDFDGALRALAKKHPRSAVLVLRAGLGLPQPVSILERLSSAGDLPELTVFPGNYSDDFNPFTAWPEDADPAQPARLLYWCSQGCWETIAAPANPDCVLVGPGRARLGADALQSTSAGLIDEAFAFDQTLPVRSEVCLDADCAAMPLGQARLRLRQLGLSGTGAAERGDPELPVTLHIAHSWGGGVWRWIEDFIAGDRDGVNLVLIADGDRSGEICGRGLKLFIGSTSQSLIREIPLAPHITSTVESHSQYRTVLEQILNRFGVGRVVVSSLIGHSLDCLTSGLPTVQVLHDFYPVWPLLDFDPLPYIDKKSGVARTQAFARHGDTLRMRPRDPDFWKEIADAWRRTIDNNTITLVAPADHVIQRWKMLNAGAKLEISKIPHAFRPFSDCRKARRPDPKDSLHLVIPGRLTKGKGIELLEAALPELRSMARITALGCGREAFRLFGQAGIDLICNYRHDQFPALVRKLRPHAALFLSTVPETWNFALSEVQSVGLVPIATRVGSFPERIRHRRDGLLFDPNPEALVKAVESVASNLGMLDQLASGKHSFQTPEKLVSRFNLLIPGETGRRHSPKAAEDTDLMLGKLANELAQLEMRYAGVAAESERLAAELDKRTEWAVRLDRRFRERSNWLDSLKSELESARDAHARLQKDFEARTEWSRSLDKELESARKTVAKLQGEVEDRTRWSKSLEKELAAARDACAGLQQDLEARTEWSRSLDRELESARKTVAKLQDEVEDRTRWSKSLEKELAAARDAYAGLQQDFETRTKWSKSLDKALAAARDAYAGLQKDFEARTKWSQSLDKELVALRDAYAGLQQDFEARTEWSQSLDKELTAVRESYANLNDELEEKVAWALRLDEEIQQSRSDMASLRAEFDERTQWALRLEREKKELETIVGHEIERVRDQLERERVSRQTAEAGLNDAHQEIAKREHAIAQLDRELYESGQTLDETRARLETRDMQIEELFKRQEQLESELNTVTGSRSWRLTRPLRFAARLGRNAVQRRAFNPLRWPRLAGRFFHHWKLRGPRQAIMLLQSSPVSATRHVSIPPQVVPVAGQIAEPVAFDAPEHPEVSVIVPVYNQLHFTSTCIQSLVSVQNQIGFEVIVVDDCSSDETRSWLKLCRGIRYLRNRRNKGFIRTCNRGAGAASGRWLVFLNNDTRVTDGWLDALIATFTENPSAGVVGGRLVFADGTLQEAGGIVFRDASGWNYGRGESPDRPEFNFLSEADYVSGACLAIERALFSELDGFDTYYAPAYYEDTDLCFRVRERGLKVYYQPTSTVIHFEGGTSGTDESTGIKQHQSINREKFLERWREILRTYPENPQQYSNRAARELRYRRFARRALVIDATTPMPDHDSGSVRMFALLRLLDELGYQTSFLPENRLWVGRHSSDLQSVGIEVLTAPWVQDPEAWLSEHGAELDLVIVSRHYILNPLLKMLRTLCPNARLIFDTVDLHFLREQREAEISGTESAAIAAGKTRKQELGLIETTDATLVVSQFEQQLLQSLLPDANISVVSNIHTLRDPGKPFEERHDLVFVGGFQHPPNLDAANWLIDEIMPMVLKELPNLTLHIIGSRMPESLQRRRASGIKLHGFVADMEPYMTGCRISVAPLRYGAGVKGKVNQAMSHGLPVVATSCAAEGMYTEHGVDILMADEAHRFAAEVVRLYQDRELWQSLAQNGRMNVENHFSVSAARQAVMGTLESVGLAVSAGGERN